MKGLMYGKNIIDCELSKNNIILILGLLSDKKYDLSSLKQNEDFQLISHT